MLRKNTSVCRVPDVFLGTAVRLCQRRIQHGCRDLERGGLPFYLTPCSTG